jgi:hypothetical protein
VDRWLALTGTDSGMTSRTNEGTSGKGTRTVAVVSTRPSGRRHGVPSQAMARRPDSSNAWSRNAIRAAACARPAASSPVPAVTYARPASRAAWLTAYDPAWTRASIITR